jgi:hypothetical protein
MAQEYAKQVATRSKQQQKKYYKGTLLNTLQQFAAIAKREAECGALQEGKGGNGVSVFPQLRSHLRAFIRDCLCLWKNMVHGEHRSINIVMQ